MQCVAWALGGSFNCLLWNYVERFTNREGPLSQSSSKPFLVVVFVCFKSLLAFFQERLIAQSFQERYPHVPLPFRLCI